MKLAERTLTIPVGDEFKDVTVYGTTGNPVLDQASVKMLYDTGKLIETTDILSNIPEQRGTVPGSEYVKQVLGKVDVLDPNRTKIEVEVCKVQYVRIFPGGEGVKEHPHPEGEVYRIPKNSGKGTLKLGEDLIDLGPERFYHIATELSHGLNPTEEEELLVLVFKFSPLLKDVFQEGYNLQLQLAHKK